MKRTTTAVIGAATALTLALAGCGGDDEPADPNAPVTITLGAWSLASTPEFKALADGFKVGHPNVTVELKEYDAPNYDTQMTADLAAGTAPDVYVLKNLKNFYTYQSGAQLLDVSDAAADLKSVPAVSSYQVDGKTYAIPYRQDLWVLYYNKDLFAKAKVPLPDGSWTWDDYVTTAQSLTTGLKAAGATTVTGAYQHVWQSPVQGFALAQTPGADLLSGDFGYMKPYYQRSLTLQSAGAQPSFGTANTNKLTYQAQFGKQQSAMLLMGTWYVATLLNQRKSGDADTFGWGLAPAPQFDKSTTGTSATPVSFGDPTGMGINPKISKAKTAAAMDFLSYIASEDAAKTLAGIGSTPATISDAVTKTIFALDGVPQDDLSKFTFGKHTIKPENPVSKHTTALQNLLNDMHTAVLSNSKGLDEAINESQKRAKNEVLKQ
ncbi:ABC transporter substrate-binding protein [Micromonospora sp. NPDC003944]